VNYLQQLAKFPLRSQEYEFSFIFSEPTRLCNAGVYYKLLLEHINIIHAQITPTLEYMCLGGPRLEETTFYFSFLPNLHANIVSNKKNEKSEK
jgi:hypothetical protein